MSVASRLRLVFALNIALLFAVLVFHVRAIQGAVESGQTLTAISDRLRAISNTQLTRIGEMSVTAEKYAVTHDQGYLEKFSQLADVFGSELRRLESLELTEQERARVVSLAGRWRLVEHRARLLSDAGAALPVAPEDLLGLQQALDSVRVGTQLMGEASQRAMTRELAASERAARAAERVSGLTAVMAVILSALLAVLLIRSIVRPLGRLADGTREISAGRFGYRIDGDGGDEFSEVARDFNSMAERLEQLDRMKRDFVSNVSHDLKTPLSSIQETTVAILDQLAGPLSERQRRLLELNQESGRRLSSMIAKLLELSRLESVRTPTFELVDLVPLACRATDRANAARSLRQGESVGGPVATVADPKRQVLVRADAEGITQLLDNLIENAVKFSPSDGRVTVTIESDAGDTNVILSIADEGPGIPDADKERVFERFYQTETGRAVRSRGVGLGLSICRHIAGVHGGRIWVSDNAPRGAVVNVWLPGFATGAEHQVKAEPPTFAAAST